MTYETSSIWNDTKKLYEPPKSTRFFDQSDLPDLKNYVHIQSNRQVLLNSQTSNVNYNPFSYPQQKTKSNLPVDFFHLQNKISIVEQVSSSDSNIIPTFELTPEQFANPIKFIESISATGRKYGAVKIIPPSVPTTATSNGSNGTSNGAPSSEADSFKTNFQINADLFWFQTNRLLNNPNGDELNNRLKFHQELIKFHLNHAKESRNPSPIPSSKGDNADGKVGDGDAMVIDEPTGASVAASSPILTPVRIPQTTEAETKPEVKIENNDVEGIKKGESVSVSVEQIQPELPREGPQASQSTPPAVLQAAEPEGRKEAEPIRTQAEEESNRMTPTMELKVLSTQDPVVVPEQMPPPDRNPSKSVPQDEQSPIIESQRTKSDPIVKSEQDVSVPSDTPKTETKPKKIQLPSFLNKLPMIDKRPLDLYKLFRSVLMRGGFVEVINKKLWAQIGRELGYRGKIMTSLSSSLKSSYMKILYPFELYLAKTREKKRETHPHETSQKRRRINDTPLILGSPKTFKRSVRLKADKGFLLNSPHLTDVKQPTTLVSKKLEFYSVADASPDGTPNPQTPPPPPPPVVENLVAETKKRKGKNKLTVINTGDKVNNIPITPTSQLNYSLKSLVEIPGVQDALQFTSNGRFSSVYTLRQFMEKDLKFQEFLIQKNDSKFSKVPYGGISSEEATSLVSKFTYYNPKDGLSNGVVSPIVTSASSAPTPTSTHVPVPTTVPGGDKVPVNSLTEKNVIHIEKLEEMYWKFASNKEENLISGEGDVEGDLDLLHDGLEIENGVSLPSLVNGSGFVRLGDDLLNYKNILANVSTNSVSSGPQQGSSTNNTATPVVAHASGIASPNSSGSTTANSSSRAPGSAFDGAYYNSSDYSSKIIRSSLNPWNLHNLPILPNSLFGALGEHDVNNQDLYIPTLNIGMTFSTENWHAEDHFTQLCNYQFFGGHRKWYFIPEEEFDKFEELIIERTNDERRIHVNNNSWDCEALIQNFTTNTKTSADDLSSDSGKNNIENEALISSLENMIPPYLDYNNSRLEHKNPTFQKLIDFQRVKRSKGNKKLVPSLNQDCFITPETLEEAGINYTYAIQKPGEFIIKFPKTYSSTISFGLNLSEEVNFATSNWLDYALEGEKWINKQLLLPNFLTFKLLINLAQLHETTSPKNKVYFDAEVYCKALEMYEKLYEKEVENREKVRTLTKNIKEVIEEKSFLDGDSIADDDLKNIFLQNSNN